MPEVRELNINYSLQDYSPLDWEWVFLILEAKKFGLTPGEIRSFLQKKSNHINDVVVTHSISVSHPEKRQSDLNTHRVFSKRYYQVHTSQS